MPLVPTSNLISVYQSIVEPYLDYGRVAWDDISDQLTDKLQMLQNCAARVIVGADYRMPTSELLSKLGRSSLKLRFLNYACVLMTRGLIDHKKRDPWLIKLPVGLKVKILLSNVLCLFFLFRLFSQKVKFPAFRSSFAKPSSGFLSSQWLPSSW